MATKTIVIIIKNYPHFSDCQKLLKTLVSFHISFISFPLKVPFCSTTSMEATELSSNSKENFQNEIKKTFSSLSVFIAALNVLDTFVFVRGISVKTFDVNSALIPFVLSEVYFIVYVHTYFIL